MVIIFNSFRDTTVNCARESPSRAKRIRRARLNAPHLSEQTGFALHASRVDSWLSRFFSVVLTGLGRGGLGRDRGVR